MIERKARGNAASRRAAIHLPCPEDAEIEGGCAITGHGVVRQDSAIEEGEIGIVRMLEDDLRARRRCDLARGVDQCLERRSVHGEANARGR